MRAIFLLVFFSTFLFLIFGSLGLKTPDECNRLARLSERIPCLHTAAVTAAYTLKEQSPTQAESAARGICSQIYAISTQYPTSELGQRASTESNDCYFDIAKILRKPSICDSMADDNFGTGLFGSPTNKDMCEEETTKLLSYQTLGPSNLCALLFIFPVLFVGITIYRKS
ncbi:hypothetical protein HZC07_02855 [Candidatus Micrarchaeota archaeon]|nr:hypothetical protein [Candidatus Micrarchaeota archaeon]